MLKATLFVQANGKFTPYPQGIDLALQYMLLRFQVKVASLGLSKFRPQLINIIVIVLDRVSESLELLLEVLHHVCQVVLQLESILFEDLKLSFEFRILAPG